MTGLLSKKIYWLVLCTVFCCTDIFGQGYRRYRKTRDVILSAGTGAATFFGDLNDKGDLIDFSGNINLGLQFFISGRASIRTEFNWFRLSGDDSESKVEGKARRNLSFISDNYEFNTVGLIQLFPEGRSYYRRPVYNVYGFFGLGLLYFNPKAEYNGQKYALQPLQTEGVEYSRMAVVIPYGIGVRLRLNTYFNVVLEGGFRQTFTDYLDDVSTIYVANSSFEPGSIAQILADRRPEIGLPVLENGSQRGNPDSKDNYFLYNVKLEFYLPPMFSRSSRSRRYTPKSRSRMGRSSLKRRSVRRRR